jgi:hypothetical protein
MHMQKMNEGMQVSPTAQEFHMILNNFTAIKGVPRGALALSSKKANQLKKIDSGLLQKDSLL